MLSKSKIIELIDNDSLPAIRSGNTHPFTDVWMVTYDNRIFVRSGKMVPGDSWYDAFLRHPVGAIKVDGKIIEVTTQIPSDIDQLKDKINSAFKLKYGGKHPILVRAMYRRHLVKHTMEFIIKD